MLERRASPPSRQAMTPPGSRFAPQRKGKVPLHAFLQWASSRLPVAMEREILFLQPCLMSIVIRKSAASYWESFLLTVLAPGRLKAFDKVANAQCICFPMPVAGDGIRASGRFDQNVRPQNARRNLHRCYLGSGNAFFAAAEHPPFYPSDSQRIDYNPSREKKVSLGPAAGAETLIWGGCAEICRVWSRRSYTHSSAPFFHIHTYPTMRIARKIRISIRPKTPSDLNLTAHGKRKIVSTSNTTNSIAMM